MKKTNIAITIFTTIFLLSSNSYAGTNSYKAVYKCFSSGVEWESVTPCPPAATPIQNGMNFSNNRMPDENKINPYRNGNRPSIFSIKARYKGYRDDLRFNNVRNGDQNYLNARLAELNRFEQIELNAAR